MDRVLIAIDLDAATDRVVATGRAVAAALGAEITLVHVAAPDPDFVGFDVGNQQERDALAQELREEHRALQATGEALGDDLGQSVDTILARGPTAATILEVADHLDTNLLVVGSRGRGAVKQLVLGSVSANVVKGARIPVLIVPIH